MMTTATSCSPSSLDHSLECALLRRFANQILVVDPVVADDPVLFHENVEDNLVDDEDLVVANPFIVIHSAVGK